MPILRYKRAQNSSSGGFGDEDWRGAYIPDGKLTFKPTDSDDPSATVNELAMLLTAGKMSESHRKIVVVAYKRFMRRNQDDSLKARALERALKLFLISSSFHATNHAQATGNRMRESTTQASRERPFKALIVLFLLGGSDSFNLLVCV